MKKEFLGTISTGPDSNPNTSLRVLKFATVVSKKDVIINKFK